MAPLLLDFSGEDSADTTATEVVSVAPTWESLGQNETMQAQWEKLGIPLEEAANIINDKFDYGIEPIALGITALLLLGYWIVMLSVSKRLYREVITEKFGNR